MPHYTNQVLQGILTNLPRDYSFRMDSQRFQTFFYNLQNSGNPLVQGIPFDTDGIHPSSQNLYDAWYGLLTSGLVNFSPPEVDFWVINSKAMKCSFDLFCKKNFNPQELSELEKITQEFQKQFPKV